MKQVVKMQFVANMGDKVTIKLVQVIPAAGASLWEVREQRPHDCERLIFDTFAKWEALQIYRERVYFYI